MSLRETGARGAREVAHADLRLGPEVPTAVVAKVLEDNREATFGEARPDVRRGEGRRETADGGKAGAIFVSPARTRPRAGRRQVDRLARVGDKAARAVGGDERGIDIGVGHRLSVADRVGSWTARRGATNEGTPASQALPWVRAPNDTPALDANLACATPEALHSTSHRK